MDVVAGGHDDGDAARARKRSRRAPERRDELGEARAPNSARVGAPGGGAGPPGRIPHQVSLRRTAAWVCARGSMKSSAGKGATWEKRRRYARASAADPGGAMKTRRTCAAQTSASTSRNALAWRSAATDPSARASRPRSWRCTRTATPRRRRRARGAASAAPRPTNPRHRRRRRREGSAPTSPDPASRCCGRTRPSPRRASGARPAPRTEKTSRADDAAVARPRAREPAPAAT